MSTRLARRKLVGFLAGLLGATILMAGTSVAAAGNGGTSRESAVSGIAAWQYYELRARHSDKCLDVDGRGAGGAGADFANVMQYQCWGGANQQWRFAYVGNGYYELRARHSDKCLDVDGRGAGGAGADFANVMQYQCWGGVNQQWRFAYIGS
ncbi:RICIN domain-containing protein [Lentzea tibetensis]|uniref:RICIN domain-containing protein n=1 Tax=Lentzea tibetensis TaxID=2591470 RepID=UPI001C990BCD|nr:RICIN domain-containing protein [Lentzea tibetensis]